MLKSTKLLFLAAGFFVLSGCFALPVEEPLLPPPVVQAFTPAEHVTMVAARGTLQRYRQLNVRIVPAREEVLVFDVPDVYISSINVEVGDEVSAGDIVAELEREAFVRAIYLAQREITAANINLTHLDERQPLSELLSVAQGEAVDYNLYTDERFGYTAELAARRLTTAHLQAEDERRILRAGMDGTVTHTMAFRPGDQSMIDMRVVTIADETRSLFAVDGWEARYLIPGDIHFVYVNREPLEAIVICADEWGVSREGDDVAYLSVLDESTVFPERTFATMTLILEELTNVIFIPFNAVHEVYEQEFVYVMEDGIRVIRHITTGMEGNYGVEVIQGLSEGDIVVID